MTQKSMHKNILRCQYFQTKNLSQIISNKAINNHPKYLAGHNLKIIIIQTLITQFKGIIIQYIKSTKVRINFIH